MRYIVIWLYYRTIGVTYLVVSSCAHKPHVPSVLIFSSFSCNMSDKTFQLFFQLSHVVFFLQGFLALILPTSRCWSAWVSLRVGSLQQPFTGIDRTRGTLATFCRGDGMISSSVWWWNMRKRFMLLISISLKLHFWMQLLSSPQVNSSRLTV